MSRSIWKGYFIDTFFFRNLKKRQKNLKIWSRQSTIPENLIGVTVFVHNGQSFKNLNITREKVGFKFGAFIKTRTKPSMTKIKKNKK